MKNIKEIAIGIFALIGFTTIIMGFKNAEQPQDVSYGTPESHVWEMQDGAGQTAYLYNKVTGEVRIYVNDRKDVYWVPQIKE